MPILDFHQLNWRDDKISLRELRLMERKWTHLKPGTQTSILSWLKDAALVPEDEYPSPMDPKRLNADSISMLYLASFAREWDLWGLSTPKEFLDGLEFEIQDTNRKDSLINLLAAVGRDYAS